MDDSIIKNTAALRDRAWQTLIATREYIAFRALNDAVKAMGGESKAEYAATIAKLASPVRPAMHYGGGPAVASPANFTRKLSQADAAEQILRETGKPMTGANLLKALPAKGVQVGGEKPDVNFTSTLSRDERFYSLRENGTYFWWLVGLPVPPRSDETPDLPLENGSSASVSSSGQKGGEGNAPATT